MTVNTDIETDIELEADADVDICIEADADVDINIEADAKVDIEADVDAELTSTQQSLLLTTTAFSTFSANNGDAAGGSHR